MAGSAQSAWAIDVGNNSLKALRMHIAGDEVEVIGLDYIEHSRILSGSGVTEEERADIIAETLRIFAQRNNIGNEDIAVSVPGQSSFARFVKLPPVEPKRIPEIVRFEAVQQIPFDINEVEWDWQIMEKADSPEIEVGIFAIKSELISDYLEHFSNEHIKISIVQMSPIALYNYVHYDRDDLSANDKKAMVVLDMGAENIDLIVCTKSSVWQRCIPLGGNTFTNAIAEAFKLKFSKAEKLKRGAVMSKYARQIFHSMRPVFTDFSAEIQRSLGYYSSSNQGVEFSKIIVLGGGFKLQGLVKYLGQALQIPVVRPDSFEKLTAGADISSAKLHEGIADFGVVYGLGLQALGRAKIESNLIPGKIAQAMVWASKSRYFTIAASMLLILCLISFAKSSFDNKAYFNRDAELSRNSIERVIQQTKTAKQRLSSEKRRDSGYEQIIGKHMDVFKYRSIIPELYETITSCLPSAENNPEQGDVYEAFEQKDITGLLKTPRNQRKQLFITQFSMNYAKSLTKAPLSGSQFNRRKARTPTSSGGDMSGDPMMEPMMERESFSPPSRRARTRDRGDESPSRRGRSARETVKGEEPEGLKDGAGFVITFEGYSPYKEIDELLDPAGVGEDQSKWGFVTRLMNLDKLVADGNTPFKLFSKKFEHFKLDTGIVEVDVAVKGSMPTDIGIRQEKLRGPVEEESDTKDRDRTTRKTSARESDRITSETVLIDPMTKEEISKTFDLNEKGEKKYDEFGEPAYTVRDHWFKISVKILWKNASKEKVEEEVGRRGRRGRRERC